MYEKSTDKTVCQLTECVVRWPLDTHYGLSTNANTVAAAKEIQLDAESDTVRDPTHFHTGQDIP